MLQDEITCSIHCFDLYSHRDGSNMSGVCARDTAFEGGVCEEVCDAYVTYTKRVKSVVAAEHVGVYMCFVALWSSGLVV